MKLSAYDRAQITSALKRSNQRLAQIVKSLKAAGVEKPKESELYKSQIAHFKNGVYEKFIAESQAGKEFYRLDPETGERKLYAVTKGGVDKFDIRSILKAIESDELDPSEANDFLVSAAGIRISPKGVVTPTSQGGIETISKIKKQARETFGKLPDDELLQKYDELLDARSNFRYDYKAFTEEHGASGVQNNETIRKLFKENRPENGLDYDTFLEIHREIINQTKSLKKKALYYKEQLK